MSRRRIGKMLKQDRLALEESLAFLQKQMTELNAQYNDQMRRYEQMLERHDDGADVMLACAQSTLEMVKQAQAQYASVYDRINQNSEIDRRDVDKRNSRVGVGVGIGTALVSGTLGAISLSQCIEADSRGLMVRKNVKRFFEGINPMTIFRGK